MLIYVCSRKRWHKPVGRDGCQFPRCGGAALQVDEPDPEPDAAPVIVPEPVVEQNASKTTEAEPATTATQDARADKPVVVAEVKAVEPMIVTPPPEITKTQPLSDPGVTASTESSTTKTDMSAQSTIVPPPPETTKTPPLSHPEVTASTQSSTSKADISVKSTTVTPPPGTAKPPPPPGNTAVQAPSGRFKKIAISGAVAAVVLGVGIAGTHYTRKHPAAVNLTTMPVQQVLLQQITPAAIKAEGDRRWQAGQHDDGVLLLEEAARRGSGPADAELAKFYDPNETLDASARLPPDARASAQYYSDAAKREIDVAQPRERLRASLAAKADAGDTLARLTLKDFWP